MHPFEQVVAKGPGLQDDQAVREASLVLPDPVEVERRLDARVVSTVITRSLPAQTLVVHTRRVISVHVGHGVSELFSTSGG